jgi:hypothetical protein
VDNDNNDEEQTGPPTEQTPATTGQLHLDLYKHLTTLSAGSLVLIATFLKDIFPRTNGWLSVGLGLKLLIGASFVALGLSLLSSVWFMLQVSNSAIAEHQPETAVRNYIERGRAKGLQLTASLGFWVGLLCFGLAVLINLFGNEQDQMRPAEKLGREESIAEDSIHEGSSRTKSTPPARSTREAP